MSADSPRHGGGSRQAVPATVPPQVVSDRSILDSAIGFINDVTLAHQPHTDPKDTITWARFETTADISDSRFGEDWELEGNVAPPLLLILGYGLGVQVWAIPANGEAVEVLSWRHGIVSALRVLPTPASSSAIEENGRADEPVDAFAEKRPLIAMVDGGSSTGAQPQFCAVNFVSLKTGAQVKTIKFKNPVLDILANRSSIVITFHERIAVFDARTLEDRLSITTCYPSPGINPNPVALGPRWLAYAEHKLLHSKRSGGGCDGDGVASYTATMLNAAKSFGKGLRELGETVAMGLTGTTGSGGASKNNSFDSNSGADFRQPGIITIMDVKHAIKDYSPTSGAPMPGHAGNDPIVAHFIAHSEAVVAIEFDNSGLLLLSADRRGHDFHVYRIQPHPVGSSLAAVHHLYVLHRGDTSAKVQNISFSLDSRWVAVSTLRGTTHVFPITPYGGAMGVRTHTSLHVVNKLSRFHRSAGLSAEGRSSSPISHSESTTFVHSLHPFHNSTLPPFPRPTVVLPLAQLRQPFALGTPPGSATMAVGGAGSKSGGAGGSGASQRQRLTSLSDDNGKPLSVCAIFAKSRSWLLEPPNATREAPHRIQRKAVDSLFVMAGHGALIQYDLDTKLASKKEALLPYFLTKRIPLPYFHVGVAKEKICDDTPIELDVEAKAQWNLVRRKDGSQEIIPPLSLDNWLIKDRNSCMLTDSTRHFDDSDDRGESWLSQVEIITHAGPHRRLWMGPQFTFKTYNTPSGSNLNHVDVEAVEIGVNKNTTTAAATTTRIVERSSPLNMPLSAAGRSAVPVLIESGSYSSIEQSPKLMDRFRHEHLDSDFAVAHGDSRLKEDLADAMRESPSVSSSHTGRFPLLPSDAASGDNVPFYDALAEHDDDEQSLGLSHRFGSSAANLASVLPNISSYDNYETKDIRQHKVSVEKVVNVFGTVTTVTSGICAEVQKDILDEVVSQLAAEDIVIHENCDEALFRPVVAIFCDEETQKRGEEEARKMRELCKPPEVIGNKLIVPVIAKEVDAELCKKEKQKSDAKRREQECDKDVQKQFAEFSTINKRSKGKPSKDVNIKIAIPNENVSKKVETKPIKKSVKQESVAEKSEVKVELKTVEQKSEENELLIKEKTPFEVKAEKVDVLDEDKPTSSRYSNENKIIEVPVVKPRKVASEEKLLDSKDIEKKESSKKSKSKSEERDLKLIQESVDDDLSLKVKRITPLVTEKSTKQTANVAESRSAKERTAAAVENKTISKAAIKQQTKEIKSTPKSDIKEQQTNKNISSKTIKSKKDVELNETKDESQQLSVADLPDSFIEIKDKIESKREDKKTYTDHKTETTTAKPEEKLLLNPVEIYAVPKTVNKLKQNKSESISETEEVVEVLAIKNVKSMRMNVVSVTEVKPSKTDKKKLEKKSSESSDDSYTDLADSLLENKSKMEDTMFVSFTQTETTSDSIKLEIENEISANNDLQISSKKETTKLNEAKVSECVADKKDNTKTKKGTAKVVEVKTNEGKLKVEKETTSTIENEEKPIKEEICSFKKSGNTETKEKNDGVEGMKKVRDVVDNLEDQKEALKEVKVNETLLDKSKESKGAIKKENKQKDTSKGKDLEQKTKKVDTLTKVPIVESAPKIESKSVEIKTNKDSKTDICAPKPQKKNLTNVDVIDAPKVVSPPLSIEELKIKKFQNDAILEEVRVIPEQPIKIIKSKKEEIQSVLCKKERSENIPLPAFKTSDPKEVATTIEKNYKAKKIAKIISPKSSSTVDEIDGVASESLVNAKTSMPKSIESKAVTEKLEDIPTPAPSVWQQLGGAELLKTINDINTENISKQEQYPSLGKMGKSKKVTKPLLTELETKPEKLLPDLPTPPKLPSDFKEPIAVTRINTKTKKMLSTTFDDFPLLKPLEELPPLPSLEPLQLFSDDFLISKDTLTEQMSLINFESPEKQENPELERKMTPSPRGFKEENLVFALCGSLHYENESNTMTTTTTKRETTPEKSDMSLSQSLTRSATDYKLLTENDEPYLSLDQSSQETNTTTTTTNDKISSSSPNSSSEEILLGEEKKMTKNQRRKKHLMDLQKQREQQLNDSVNDADEELCPLIEMSDSQMDNFGTNRDRIVASSPTPLPRETMLLMDDSFTLSPRQTSISSRVHYTTTDSEGPMPATTSDDNAYALPTAGMTSSAPPNKLKTKKLEHKINLIAAIEAATSSSTSSAEESGQETGSGNGRSSEMDSGMPPPLITIAATVAQHDRHQIQQISGISTAMQSGGTKKKTKRRKR